MKRLTYYQSLFILLLITLLSSTSQAQDFEWAKFLYATDGSVSKEIKDMTKDDEGNIYVLGEYNRKSVIEEDTIEIHGNGKESCYISKYSQEGRLLWINPFGSQSYDFANNIVYADGHVFASVFLQGDKIYHKDGEFPSIGNKEGMLIKFDINGDYVSHNQFLRGFYFNAIEKVDTMIYAAFNNEIYKLNFDLETVGNIKFNASQFIRVDDMVNVKDTAVLLTGTFGIDFIYQDTVLNPALTGEGYKAFATSINVEKDSMHWIHAFGKVHQGLKLAYPGGGRFYLAGNYTTDFELAGHLNPLYKFSGWHGFVAECALDGRIFKSKQMIPTEGAGSQEITALLASGNGVFVAGKVNYGLVKYDDSDTLMHKRGNRFGYVFKLDETIDYEYAVAIGPENTSFGEIFTGVVDENKLYFGGRVHGADTYIGCDVYNTNGQVVFQMIDRAPDETPIVRFRYSRSRGAGSVRFYTTIQNADWHYWDFGDESDYDSLAINPRHTYGRKGAITVKLHAGNKCGERVVEQTILIKGIGSMFPKVAGHNSFYVGQVKGVGFKEGATFRLITAQGREKEIRQTHFVDSATYNIMVELSSNPQETYDLYMENGEERDTLRNALKVELAEKAHILCHWEGQSSVLGLRNFSYTLNIENQGNTTAYGVPITIMGPRDCHIETKVPLVSNDITREWVERMGGDFRVMDGGNSLGYVRLGTIFIPEVRPNRPIKIGFHVRFDKEGPDDRLRAFYDPPMFPPTSFFLDLDAIPGDSLICPGSRVVTQLLELFGLDEEEAEAGFNLSSMGCVMYSYLVELFGGVEGFGGTGFGGGNPPSTFLGNIPAGNLGTSTAAVNMGPIILEGMAAGYPDKTPEELISEYDKMTETIPDHYDHESNDSGGETGPPIEVEYPSDILCVTNCDTELKIIREEGCAGDGCLLTLEPIVDDGTRDMNYWANEDPSLWPQWMKDMFNTENPEFNHVYPDNEEDPGNSKLNKALLEAAKEPSLIDQGLKWLYEAAMEIKFRLSRDPNAKYPILGYGEENYIEKNRRLNYHVTFENADSATAPASEVFVYDTLDLSVMDTTTFSWNMIGWGDFSKVIEQQGTHIIEYVDTRPHGGNIIVEFEGKVDSMGVLSAVYTSLDTATWALTEVVDDGFLPPNVTAPEGEGFFNFSIGQQQDLPHGTRIENKATIIFDRNEPIVTDMALNTIDDQAPVSSVAPFDADVQYDSLVQVNFQGIDDGSGIDGFNVFVKKNSGSYVLFAQNYDKGYLKVLANYGDTLSFFISATDKVGNVERKNLKTEARIAVVKKVTGINEQLNNQFTFYPNPTDGALNIHSKLNEHLLSYSIVDLAGKTLIQRSITQNSELSINLQTLKTGVYIIDLQTDLGRIRKKIIKK